MPHQWGDEEGEFFYFMNESFKMALELWICMRTTAIVIFTSLQINAYTSSVGVGPGAVSSVETSWCSSPLSRAAAALSSFLMPVWEFLHVGASLADAAAIYITFCYNPVDVIVRIIIDYEFVLI